MASLLPPAPTVANITTPNFPGEYVIVSNVSQILGILSLMVWLFAQLPQVLENYVNHSVDGVSPTFLTCWISGDATNLVGCILSRALPFQICLAAYYCFIDLILSLQFWYYTRVYPRQKVHHNMLQSPNMMRPVLLRGSTHNVHHSRTNRFETPAHHLLHSPIRNSSRRGSRPKRKSLFMKLLSTSILGSSVGKANAMPVDSVTSDTPSNLVKFRTALTAVGVILQQLESKVLLANYNAALVGKICGWISSVLYLSSRSPQIWKNYKSKATKGISPYLFLFAMIGNTFYSISILSDLYLLRQYDLHLGDTNFDDVLFAQLPFIIGSAGTVLFDSILLFQFWYYQPESEHIPPVDDDAFGFNLHFNASTFHHSPQRKTQAKRQQQSSFKHFTKPDWYTNNYSHELDDNEDFSGHYNYAVQRYGATSNGHTDSGYAARAQAERSQPEEVSSFRNSAFNIPPPPHYISSSSSHSHHIMHNKGRKGLSATFGAIARSFSQSSSMLRSPSMSSTHSGSGAASPMANTSLLPSLVGTYSSVSKKMLNDSKIPFLPSDFLNNDFIPRSG